MDIVEKLRAGHQYSGMVDPVEIEAADEIERLRAALKQIVGNSEYLSSVSDKELAQNALEQSACQECKDELPSLNWRNGKPYSYCPECGREEDHS